MKRTWFDRNGWYVVGGLLAFSVFCQFMAAVTK